MDEGGDSFSWCFHFRRPPLDWELDSLAGLLGLLDSVSLSNSPDKRVWLTDSSGSFSCASFFTFLTRSSPNHPLFPVSNLIWGSKVPQKVTGFCWTASLDKINTRDNLQKRRPH